ncbi:MAG TPA: hypothetical protein VHO25_18065 [Polyangiaceae bacterium]|nr:hypothetical protein [Polyangiaceae bacterium]
MFERQHGFVSKRDAKTHRVKVTLPDRQNLESPWLDVFIEAGRLPKAGALVCVLLDENGESGCVLGSVHSKQNPPPEGATDDLWLIQFDDGAMLKYDPATKVMAFATPGGGFVDVAGGAEKLSVASKVEDELNAIRQLIQGLVLPLNIPGGVAGPLTAPVGPASDVGSAQGRTS